jgi:hypothetical protein
MKLGDFPVERTLEYKARHSTDLFDLVDDTCPEGLPFSAVTEMNEDQAARTRAFSKLFYTAHVDPYTQPNPNLVAEPFHFGLHVARLLEGGELRKISIPDTAEWVVPANSGGEIDTGIFVHYYLGENYRLDAIIRTYMDRISGKEMLDLGISMEPDEIKHARLLAGAAFLIVDIINSHDFQDNLPANDAATIAEFEKQFQM